MKKVEFNGKAPTDQVTYLWMLRTLHEMEPEQVDKKSLASFMRDLLQNNILQTFEPTIRNEIISRIHEQGKRLGLDEQILRS